MEQMLRRWVFGQNEGTVRKGRNSLQTRGSGTEPIIPPEQPGLWRAHAPEICNNFSRSDNLQWVVKALAPFHHLDRQGLKWRRVGRREGHGRGQVWKLVTQKRNPFIHTMSLLQLKMTEFK